MTLKQRLDAVRADFESKVPPEALRVMHASTEQLVASGQAQHALRAGDRAPAFVLPGEDGALISSSELLAKGPLVVSFYRGIWCPYCNLELQALEAARLAFEAEGASLVALSQQTAENSRKSRRDNDLGFPILVDHGGRTAQAFGIRWALEGDIKALYAKFGVDLAAFNGESSWTLPMPARYVIGRDGVIAYADINPDYTRRPEPEELLPVLAALNRAHAG